MKNESKETSPTACIEKLLILIRHGERIDRTGIIPKCGIMNPELSDRGKLQSFESSKILIENIKKYGVKISPNLIQIRSSPYMRTIQTSAQLLKGLNLILVNNKKEKIKILNKVIIDFGLRKRIKPEKIFEKKDILYTSVDKYTNFDEEIKNIEFIGDNGDFPLDKETNEQCKKRSLDYLNNILKKELDNKDNLYNIIIIIGHRGPMKYILKKLGFTIVDIKKMDYCSQFLFDVSKGIDNSRVLETITINNI